MSDPPLKGWDVLERLVRDYALRKCGEACQTAAMVGAEVGVSQGWTSEHLLRAFPGLTLVMVDWWDRATPGQTYVASGDAHARMAIAGQAKHRDRAELRTAFAADRRRVMVSDSVAAAERIALGVLDFALIDGDHTYPGVKRDLEAWVPRVREGGMVILHDLDHPRDLRGLWGVRRAAEEFCKANSYVLATDSKATLGWFVKAKIVIAEGGVEA